MTNTLRELFLHCQNQKPQAIHAALDERLVDVLVRAGIVGDNQTDLLIFVGEGHKLDDTEDSADDPGPVDAELPIKDLDPQHQHVHCYHCPDVAVDVHFLDRTEQRKLSPVTTIGWLTNWAHRKLRLDDAAGKDYVLRVCGTGHQPRPDEYLGELVQKDCSLCFDLVKELTPQGLSDGRS